MCVHVSSYRWNRIGRQWYGGMEFGRRPVGRSSSVPVPVSVEWAGVRVGAGEDGGSGGEKRERERERDITHNEREMTR